MKISTIRLQVEINCTMNLNAFKCSNMNSIRTMKNTLLFSSQTHAATSRFHHNHHYCTIPSTMIHHSTRSSSPRVITRSTADQYETENKNTPTKMNFTYMSQEAVDQFEQEREEARQDSMQEYEDLKALLLKRTWRFGTFFAGYLLLTVSGEAAFAELVGSAAGYGYFLWIIKDVDTYDGNTVVPLWEAEQVEPQMLKKIAKLSAAYKQSLNPRLLVPVGLVAGCAAWNALFPEYQIGLVEQGCMIGGFWSYKIALVLKIYDDLKPRALTEEEMLQNSRPELVEIEDVEFKIKRPSERRAEREAAEREAAAQEME